MIVATVLLVFLPTAVATIVTHPRAITVVNGHDASLPCVLGNNVTDGREVFWEWRPFRRPTAYLRENPWKEAPTTSSRFHVPNTGSDRSMNISGMHPADAGQYRCSVIEECANGGRSCREYGGKLSFIVHSVSVDTVNVPPRIIGSGRGGRPVTVNEGETLRLNCTAEGSSLTVKWFIDGVEVDVNTRRCFDADVKSEHNAYYDLERRNMNRDAEGTYTCKASNHLGTDEIWYFVDVSGKSSSSGTPVPRSSIVNRTDCAYRPSSNETAETWKPDYSDESALGSHGERRPPHEESTQE